MKNIRYTSELYAISQGSKCVGSEECHWCGGPCEKNWIHDDPPPVPFVRTKTTAKRPGNLYVCVGCWLYRMERITITYLDRTIKDRQNPKNHSWLITPEKAVSIRPLDYTDLYPILLNPPLVFSLSLLEDRNTSNLLQLHSLNNHTEIMANTELAFTVDNKLHTYTVYELEEGLRHGTEGKMPGVLALVRILGPYQLQEKKREAHRPKKEDRINVPENTLKRLVKKE